MCKFESEFNSVSYSFQGTYEIDGDVVLFTFTVGTVDTEKYSGKTEMALYINNGMVIDTVHKKK